MRNISMRQRLVGAFSILLTVTVVVAACGAFQSKKLFDNGDFYDWNIVPAYIAMHRVIQSASTLRHIADQSATQPAAQNAAVPELEKNIQDGFETYFKLLADEEDKRNFENVKQTLASYLATFKKLNADAPPDALGASGLAYERFSVAADKWWEYNQTLSKSYSADSRAAYQSGLATLAGLVAVAILIGIATAILLIRWMGGALGGEPAHVAQIAKEIGTGKLDTLIAVDRRDESSVMAAMYTMQRELVQIVTAVRNSSETIASASSEISAGNHDLSARTEQQAGTLEETASSIEELTSSLKLNAQNAQQANLMARSASEVASRGGTVVSEVVTTMGSINSSAKKIVDIISVIDGIAFQTNILALNAAVEAARAGEQGRGFAVVASEVRSLAQRSALAAQEIKVLIDDSVHQVESGSLLVDQAGSTMQDVVQSVQQVLDIIGDITATSIKQASEVQQIHEAVMQMDQTTQQNAALVEEAAASSESLHLQAQQLASAVGLFVLQGQPQGRLQGQLQRQLQRSGHLAPTVTPL